MKVNHVYCSCSACLIVFLPRSCAAHMGLELRAFSPFCTDIGVFSPSDFTHIDVPIFFFCLRPNP